MADAQKPLVKKAKKEQLTLAQRQEILAKLDALYPVMHTVHVFLKNTHTRRPPSKRGAPPKRGAQPPVPRCPVLRALNVM